MSLITPLLVQIALTFLVMFTLVRFRIVEIFSKRVNEDDIPLRKVEWPEKATRADSNFLSQFEMPVCSSRLLYYKWSPKQMIKCNSILLGAT